MEVERILKLVKDDQASAKREEIPMGDALQTDAHPISKSLAAQILSVKETATEQDIRAQYRQELFE